MLPTDHFVVCREDIAVPHAHWGGVELSRTLGLCQLTHGIPQFIMLGKQFDMVHSYEERGETSRHGRNALATLTLILPAGRGD